MTCLCNERGKNLEESNFYRKVKNKCKISLNLKSQMSSMWKVLYKKMVD